MFFMLKRENLRRVTQQEGEKDPFLYTNDKDLPSDNFVFEFRVLYPKTNDNPPRGECQVNITASVSN